MHGSDGLRGGCAFGERMRISGIEPVPGSDAVDGQDDRMAPWPDKARWVIA